MYMCVYVYRPIHTTGPSPQTNQGYPKTQAMSVGLPVSLVWTGLGWGAGNESDEAVSNLRIE